MNLIKKKKIQLKKYVNKLVNELMKKKVRDSSRSNDEWRYRRYK